MVEEFGRLMAKDATDIRALVTTLGLRHEGLRSALPAQYEEEGGRLAQR